VRQKATKASRKLLPDFALRKVTFLKQIEDAAKTNRIPPDLVINWDQTGSKLIPVSHWTMAEEGSKQIPVVGKEDKREVTVLLAATASGVLLFPQVIYQGKTAGCHPKITFSPKWNITHSESHWSTESTTLKYIDMVTVPYVSATRQSLRLPDNHPVLCIFDVFAAHRCDSVLD